MVKIVKKGLTYLTKDGQLIITGWIIDWEGRPLDLNKFLEIVGAKKLIKQP